MEHAAVWRKTWEEGRLEVITLEWLHTDAAETAVIDRLVSSWAKTFLFHFVYGHQDMDWLCDAPSVFYM